MINPIKNRISSINRQLLNLAEGVLYLASDESKFVTGIELPIDGGYSAQ